MAFFLRDKSLLIRAFMQQFIPLTGVFSWLCLVDREPGIDLRHKNDDQGNKTKGCSIQTDKSLFNKVGF